MSVSNVRLPAGSYIAVAPPAAGKTTLLRQALLGAGLPAANVVSRDDLRATISRCADLACRVNPTGCHHNEATVSRLADAAINSILSTDNPSWFADATGTDARHLREEVARARRCGVASVALRRADVSVEDCLVRNAGRPHPVSEAVVRKMHAAYTELSTARLYAIGFDLVVEWDEDTTFTLLPAGPDARHVDDDLVIVGDIHGCSDTFLNRLLPAVGTDASLSNADILLVSVGDIHDKGGPSDGQGCVDMIRWWLKAVKTGRALLTDSNHNRGLVRALTKPDAPVRFGLRRTLDAIERQDDAEQLKADIVATFGRLPSHLVFANHVAVHAAMTKGLLLRNDGKARSFALYTRNESRPWTWTDTRTLVHGHVVVDGAHTRRAEPGDDGTVPGPVVNIDTGAYEGGGMTAYFSATGQTLTVPTSQVDIQSDVDAQQHRDELIAAGII